MNRSSHQDEILSTVANPPSQAFPPEILQKIFSHCIEDGALGPSMIWYIYWEPELKDGSLILVPYVVMDEYELVIPKMKSKRPNPMLGVCRQSRAAALNPAKGRYASLAMLYMDELGSVDDCYDGRDRGRRVVVHPCRDVFVFHSFTWDNPWFNMPISLVNGTSGAVRQIAHYVCHEMPPYDEDTDLLQAAVQRTGFRFRNVLFPEAFYLDTNDGRSPNLWVLLHLCEDTGLHAHQFHVFLPCGNPDHPGTDGLLFPGAVPFVRTSRDFGYFPIEIYPHEMGEEDEPPDCQCREWEYGTTLFGERPALIEVLETMREDGLM